MEPITEETHLIARRNQYRYFAERRGDICCYFITALLLVFSMYISGMCLTNTLEGMREYRRFIESGTTCCDTIRNNDTAMQKLCFNMYYHGHYIRLSNSFE